MTDNVDTSAKAVETLAKLLARTSYYVGCGDEAEAPEEAAALLRALLRERDEMRDALEMIAGARPCPDYLMGDKDIARVILARNNNALR